MPKTLRPLLLLCAALLLCSAPSPARAEEDEGEVRRDPLSCRLYRVGALTRGRHAFHSQFRPVQQPPASHRRGGRSREDEPVHPLGQIDELIELLRGRVVPRFWEETEGADLAAIGERMLIVRAEAGVHAELARQLAALERRQLRTISVDVQAVRLHDGQLATLAASRGGARLDDDVVRALLAGEGAGPAVRVTTENGTRAEMFGGTQRAFLRRHTAVVRQGKTLALPVAGVTNAGLAVSVEPVEHAAGEAIRVHLEASLTAGGGARAARTADGHPLQLPATPGMQIKTDLLLAPGTWGLAHGTSDGWSLLVRATPDAATGMSRRATAVSLDAPFDPRPGAMEVRDFDVASLARVFTDVMGTGAFLHDTSWDGPAPAERPEPRPAIGAEYLVELARVCLGTESTWEDPATIEVRGGTLIMRQTKPVLAATDAWLARLRSVLPATFATTVELVQVSPALHARLTAAGRGSPALIDREERTWLQAAIAAEEATRLGTLRLTNVDGVRNAARTGRTLRYVSTYTTSRVPTADAVLPQTAAVLAGLEIDARVTASPGGEAAHVVLRAMRTDDRGRGPARLDTTHGVVELPALETLRLRATLTLPLGQTALAGVLPRGGQPVLVLLRVDPQLRTR